jgi:hypothetical protein
LRPNWSSTRELLGRTLGRGPGRSRLLALVAAEQLDDLLAHPVEVGAELDQHLARDALALADETEQDVLGPDVVVAELQRLAQAQLQDLLGTRGERDVPARRLLALADDLLDLCPHGLQRDPEALQRLCGDAFPLVDEAEQDVLGPDVVVAEHPGLFLGQDDHTTRPVGESFEHGITLLAWARSQSFGADHRHLHASPRPRTSLNRRQAAHVPSDGHISLTVNTGTGAHTQTGGSVC